MTGVNVSDSESGSGVGGAEVSFMAASISSIGGIGAAENKTVVLVGALAPARFAESDAPFNLGMAIAAVQTAAPGVWIAMNGTIFPGDKVRKNRAANTFEPV